MFPDGERASATRQKQGVPCTKSEAQGAIFAKVSVRGELRLSDFL